MVFHWYLWLSHPFFQQGFAYDLTRVFLQFWCFETITPPLVSKHPAWGGAEQGKGGKGATAIDSPSYGTSANRPQGSVGRFYSWHWLWEAWCWKGARFLDAAIHVKKKSWNCTFGEGVFALFVFRGVHPYDQVKDVFAWRRMSMRHCGAKLEYSMYFNDALNVKLCWCLLCLHCCANNFMTLPGLYVNGGLILMWGIREWCLIWVLGGGSILIALHLKGGSAQKKKKDKLNRFSHPHQTNPT